MKLRSGEVLESGPVATTPGYASEPLTPEQLWDKFAECTAKTHTTAQAHELFDLLKTIDAQPSAHALPTCTTIFKD